MYEARSVSGGKKENRQCGFTYLEGGAGAHELLDVRAELGVVGAVVVGQLPQELQHRVQLFSGFVYVGCERAG